jgi:hypothetical protein
MKKVITFLLFLLFVVNATAQDRNFNQYKYVVVNSKFDFVRQVDGYQTSSLTKFLFKKMGFVVFLNNEEFDNELAMNPCSAMYADVRDDSSFLTTRNFIELKDCRGRLLFTSLKGSSRLKQYVKAYRESIREAFQSVQAIPYNYDPNAAKKASVVEVSKEVVPEKKPVKVEKEVKVEKPTKTPDVKKEPIMVTKEVTVKNTTPVKKEVVKEDAKVDVLYAQPKDNGYQLINTKPEIVFVLLKTNSADKFIIKDKNGTFVKKGAFWIAEYYDNGVLVTKKYQVKF